jgi:hypothetical protein
MLNIYLWNRLSNDVKETSNVVSFLCWTCLILCLIMFDTCSTVSCLMLCYTVIHVNVMVAIGPIVTII